MATIKWDALLKLLWAAPLAGLAVSLSFSLVILGVSRAADARREGAGGTATAFGALTLLSAAASAAVVVYGISIIVND